MATVDVKSKSVVLKIVYYGCALGGKTTNLVTLHRLTDPDNAHGLVSIATKDDRTLFFDLLPMALGQVAGLSVKVKLYTVPGQVHYETTRRQVLAGADGVVLVIDSNPESAKANAWATDNLRLNLRANGIDPDRIPTVIQWNKRDLPDARAVEELEHQLNPRKLTSHEAIAITGPGVVQTFASILKEAILYAYRKTGRNASADQIGKTVDQALAHAAVDTVADEPLARENTFAHHFDMEAYREQQGRDKRIVDQESLLSEAINTNMLLAEKLDEYKDVKSVGDRRAGMMEALGRVAPMLADPRAAALPEGMMALLLRGAGRKHGSALLQNPKTKVMEEREVVPPGRDPMNVTVVESMGSVAHTLCQITEPRVIEDLRAEVFFDAPPAQAEGLAGVLIAPLICDGLNFGALAVYARMNESLFDEVEQEYWHTAATFIGLSLHWRALRKKLLHSQPSS